MAIAEDENGLERRLERERVRRIPRDLVPGDRVQVEHDPEHYASALRRCRGAARTVTRVLAGHEGERARGEGRARALCELWIVRARRLGGRAQQARKEEKSARRQYKRVYRD